MIKVIYPGTFDPLTRGHEDVVRRAAGLFGEVVVAVAESRSATLFTLDERVAMAKEIFADFANVRVEGFSGLLMNYVRAQTGKTFHPYIDKTSENFSCHGNTLIHGKQSGTATFCHSHHNFAE